MSDQESGWVRTDEQRLALGRAHRKIAQQEGVKHGDCDRCQMALDIEHLVREVARLRADGQRLREEVARLVRVLDDFAHAAHAVLKGDSYVGTTPEMVAANRHRLAVLAGKWDRPVTARGQ